MMMRLGEFTIFVTFAGYFYPYLGRTLDDKTFPHTLRLFLGELRCYRIGQAQSGVGATVPHGTRRLNTG